MLEKKIKIVLRKKKKKRTDKLRAFDKISVSDFKQESLDTSSSKEGEI